MKRKMKLTDLRHVETSKEEMNYLKGGEDPEKGPLCWGCMCSCQCSNENTGEITGGNNMRNARNNGTSSWVIDKLIPGF